MLLSRTADHLYWHARYIERAENTARMLGVNYDTLLMPHEPQNEINLWRATLGCPSSNRNFSNSMAKSAPKTCCDSW